MKALKRILFFADGAQGQLSALRRTYRLAVKLGAAIEVCGVIDEISTSDIRLQHNISRLQNTLIHDRELELDKLIAAIKHDPLLPAAVARVVLPGKDYEQVINRAVSGKFDLIVKSVNPHNAISTTLFGSCDLKLLHLSPCPVLILKPLRRKAWHSVLVGVDPSAETKQEVRLNAQLLAMGSAMAEIDGASLHLIHVLDHPLAEHKNTLRDEYKSLEKSLTQDAERKLSSLLEAHSAVSLTEHLVTGKPNVAITAMVRDQDIDLLVMGSVARSGLPGLLVGNTAEKVFSSVDSSVLVLKP